MSSNQGWTRLLYLVQLPPPVHGPAAMNAYVVENQAINAGLDVRVLPLVSTRNLDELNQLSVRKVWDLLVFLARLTGLLLRFRPQAVFYDPGPEYFGVSAGCGVAHDLQTLYPGTNRTSSRHRVQTTRHRSCEVDCFVWRLMVAV